MEARGSNLTANAVLKAAGLSIKVTDHDFVMMRKQRSPFVDYVLQMMMDALDLICWDGESPSHHEEPIEYGEACEPRGAHDAGQ